MKLLNLHVYPRTLLVVATFVLVVCFLNPSTVVAATSNSSDGILETLKTFGSNLGLGATDPRIIIANLIKIALSFLGIILLIMFLSSGAQFLFSGGDLEKIISAKKTFYNAVIGLIIILSAYSIVNFVIGAFGFTPDQPTK